MTSHEEQSSMEEEARALVRSFSDKLEAKEGTPTDLEVALQKEVKNADVESSRRRRQLFQTSDQGGRSFDRVNTECEHIQQAWATFIQGLDDSGDGDGKTPWKSKGKSPKIDAQLKALEVSTVDDVFEEVNRTQQQWAKKDRILSGKAQEHFHKVCAALTEHDRVFDMIPNQNNYAATLCGSIRMLIKASANHVKYAEELGQALEEVCVEIGQANILLAVMLVPEMERRVEDLYVKIFQMLRRAMGWYSSGGFRKIRFALNENLYTKLKEDVDSIRALAMSIQRDAQARGLVENRESRLLTESAAIDSRETRKITEATHGLLQDTQDTTQMNSAVLLRLYQMHQQDREQRERDRREEQQQQREWFKEQLRAAQEDLGRQLSNGLIDQAFHYLVEQANYARRSSQAMQLAETTRGEPLPGISPIVSFVAGNIHEQNEGPQAGGLGLQREAYSREDLINASEHMDEFIVGPDERDLAVRKSPSLATHLVASKLQNWSKAQKSQRLWLLGPPQFGTPSALVGAAVNVLKTANFLQIPVVAHACDRAPSSGKGLSREEAGLVGLVYSLIRQLVVLLPDKVNAESELTASRFQRLNGSSESWHDALDLLADLIDLAPPLLLCLIDGLNKLDSGSAVQMSEELLGTLNSAIEASEDDGVKAFKLLFTTSGNSRSLRKWLTRQETCMVEDPPPIRQSSNNLGDGSTPLVLRDVFEGHEADE